ncbi:serine-rich adhesin for platelets-like isoform X2 [Zophobas morio]|uniref:serine-rich adhesin for platelets-like isoform X2 n=1 Tax=Zophobas morio TaxID=2755281 RepID=UPI003083421B
MIILKIVFVLGLYNVATCLSAVSNFECSQSGRYPDPQDSGCSSYYLCSELPGGIFVKNSYTCNQGSRFDSELEECSSSYRCPGRCLVEEDRFECTDIGRFKKPNDLSCTKYYLCSRLQENVFLKNEFFCSGGSYFDDSLQQCSSSYVCPCTNTSLTTTVPPLRTTSSSKEVTTTKTSGRYNGKEDVEFKCNRTGRFSNPEDATCTKYYLCYLLIDSTYAKKEYLCPLGHLFDPVLHICTLFYRCTVTTAKPTTMSEVVTTTSVINSTCGTSQLEEFTCSTKGRFKNPQDTTCATYFLCSLLQNGSFIQTEYSCPLGSFFDPDLQICSGFYDCLCGTNRPVVSTSTVETSPLEDITTSSTANLSSESAETSSSEHITYPTTVFTFTTSTSTECFVDRNNTQEFSCSEKGRFRNPKDESCTTYFLCNLLRNGSFVETQYGCPAGSRFDPELQVCNIFYVCPCEVTSTTSEINTPSSESVEPSSSESTRLTTTPFASTTSTSTECFAHQNNIEEFSCSEEGRFRHPKDETCTTYFLCNLLRNGSFVQTPYTCPSGSRFDPELQICNIFYVCPCLVTSTTSSTSTLSSESVEPSSSGNTKSTTTSFASTTSTSTECFAHQNNIEEFSCFEEGRFRHPKDETCTTYFLCNLLRNGSFVQTQYTCPSGSRFDPELEICNIFYVCPCLVRSTTSSTSTLSSESVEPSSSGNTKSTTTHFASTTSTSTECFAHQNNIEEFSCSEEGRFRHPKDETCTTYFLCNLLRNGSFVQTQYTCPSGSRFDPELQICNIFYLCPCVVTSTISSTSTLSSESVEPSSSGNTRSTTTPFPSTTSTSTQCFAHQNNIEEFSCSEKGRFRHPEDETCTTYFLCNLLRNGSLIQTQYTCPSGSRFDPELQICNIFYLCPCLVTSTTSSTSTLSSESVETSSSESTRLTTTPFASTTSTSTECFAHQNNIEEFSCSEEGRFRHPKDETCTTYFLCNLLRNGSFVQTPYTCPSGSRFDPELQICNIFYVCPCLVTSTTSSTSTLSSESVEPSSSGNTKSTTTPFASTTSTSTECFAHQNNIEEFCCSEEGRFRHPKDETCTTYFLCNLLRNGSFVQTQYTCPSGSRFDPELEICNIFYVCPCLVRSTTSSTSTLSSESVEPSSSGNTKSTTTHFASTTSTSTECFAHQNNIEEFSCSEEGRFRHPKDETCTTYFLCNLLRNGSFVQTQYTCPSGSRFDPELQICNIFYVCPCLVTSTTSSTSTLSSASVEPSSSGNTRSTTTPFASTTATPTECFAHQNNIEEFSCSEEGRFRHPKDETCTTYFLCNLLRNGSFVQTQYTCPSGSTFDPELQICNIFYVCPCLVTSTTSSTSILSSESVEPSSSGTTRSTTSPFASTTSTSTECFAHQNNIEKFSCSEEGRFRHPKDETCTTYFLCNLLRNGSFVQTQYTCPSGSRFDPELQICNIFYVCPCLVTSTTSSTSTLSSESAEPSSSEHTRSTTTPFASTTSTSTECFAHQNDIEEFSCFEEGRFRHPKDETCTTYFLCNLLRNGSFVQTQYTCPSGSRFDPELEICNIFYVCPCLVTSTTSSTSTLSSESVEPSSSGNTRSTTTPFASTNSTSTECFAHQNNIEEFSCSEEGRFRHPKDETCTTYFLCNLLRNGSFVQTQYTCPSSSRFDPELQICNIFYVCPCLVTSTTSSTSTLSSESVEPSSSENTRSTTTPLASTTSTSTECFAYQNNIEKFSCSEEGRFRHPKDETCTTYFLCNLLRNGSFVQTQYTCPSGSRFDPELQICNIFYVCPCLVTSTTSSTSTLSSESAEPSSSEHTRSTTTPFASTTSTSTECFAHQNDIEEFSCFEEGRFRHPKDETCTTYFLCNLLRNGSFVQTQYTCPSGSRFDPELQICNIFYVCPCLVTSTTSSTSTLSSESAEPSSSEHTRSTTTPFASTTSTSTECFAHQNDIEEFSCFEEGRFRHPKDETCTTYFLCNLLRNGSFVQTQYTCPSGSRFDPELEICNIFYVCPCLVTSTTSSTSTLSSESVEPSSSENTRSTTTPFAPTTSTSTECFAHQNNIEEFSCSEEGRFRHPKDETCTTYFLCNLLRNGSFVQTQYTCPSGSRFDPELEICNIFYVCPCLVTSITSSTSTLSSESVEPSSSEHTRSTTTPFASTTSTSTECFAHQNNIEEFSCSEEGRFRHPKDETCTTYFLCNLLRNGSFVQTQYTCPYGSRFDPELQICNIFYVCPCLVTSTTSSTSTLSSESVEPSSSGNTSSTTTPFMSTTSTTTECFAHQNNKEEFSCSEEGRFRHPKDETCTTYFLCNLLKSGSFVQTQYTCPSGSRFDPELQICNIFYLCPCVVTSTISSTSTLSSESVEPSSSGNTRSTTTPFPSTTSTSTECFAHQNNIEEFSCSAKGRFRHPNDETCTTYFLCNLLRNGSFVQTQYSCPSGSRFDPELQICNIYYLCPCLVTSTTSSTSTLSSQSVEPSSSENTRSTTTPFASTTSTSTECFAHQNNIEGFSCSEEGRFRHPKDETCTTYFLCNLLRNGSFVQTQYTCPSGSRFDPELQICNIFYECPCLMTSSESVETSSSEHITYTTPAFTSTTSTSTECFVDGNNTEEFSCSEKGRFRNPKDQSCTTYFLCNLLRNGTFVQTQYICPSGSRFDPELQVCNIFYTCPCSTNVELPTLETSTTPSSTSTELTTPQACLANPNNEEFTCSEKGRFLNPKDETCSTYYLCNLLRNGTLIQTEYFCPQGSHFDPSIQICNTDYECPCTMSP